MYNFQIFPYVCDLLQWSEIRATLDMFKRFNKIIMHNFTCIFESHMLNCSELLLLIKMFAYEEI